MDKFWTAVASFYEKVDGSIWSWFPNNIESLIVQAVVNFFIIFLLWNAVVYSKILGVGYFAIYFPLNLFLLLRKNKDE